MPSINTVWIPTLVTAHVVSLCLFIYALQRISGVLTYWSWTIKYHFFLKKKFKGDYKMAWYWTYPGAKEAYDAKMAPSAVAKSDEPEIIEGEQPVPVELSWTNLVYRVKTGNPPKPKVVLHRCSGTFNSCESYAIMGPSGAGKSTVLDILSGRKIGKGIGGLVTMNDKTVTAEIASRFASYVSQEDVFVPTLTVWEALEFYTVLSLPGEFTREQRVARMNTAMRTMGLGKVRDSKVGGYMAGGVDVRGISGGEKRRLSVACGLVANPSILFLDEPTTGLDSHAALAVMKHLISLTSWGLTIVASIHQPRQEVFDAFDRILVMSEGYQVFFAPPGYCLHWFKDALGFPYDPDIDGTVADWLISVVSVTFFKTKDAAARSLSSKEEVRDASKRFAALQNEADAEGRQMIESILESATDMASEQGDYRLAVNSWLMNSLANQHLLQSNQGIGDSAAAVETMAQIQAAKEEEAELEGLEVSNWIDELDLQRQYPRKWHVQFRVLFLRTFWGTLRNPAACAVRLLMCVWVSMVAGLVYIRLPNDALSTSPRLATLFFATLLYAMNPFSYMQFFFSDRRFFIRDSANGLYAPSAYQLGTVAASMPFVVINTCAGALTFYGLAGLRNEGGHIVIFMVIFSLHALAAQQFTIFCVWVTESQDAAFTIASTYMSLCLALTGFYIRIANIRLSFLKGLSWACYTKYTFQALARNEFAGREAGNGWATTGQGTCQTKNPVPVAGGAIPLCGTPGDDVLKFYDFKLSIGDCIGALIGFWGLFMCLSYYALLKLYYKRR